MTRFVLSATRLRGLLLAAILFAPQFVSAQGSPFTGTPADVTLAPSAASVPSGSPFTVNVNVNLTGVGGTCGASTPPAVLGGYVVPIDFDKTRLQYVSAAACNSPQFSAAPVSTAPATANANGQVSIAASQANGAAPTGMVCVATLTFLAAGPPGLTTLTPDPSLSLSSAFQNCAGGGTAGPAAIAGLGSPAGVTLTPGLIAPIPVLRPPALVLLAAALAGLASFLIQKRG